MVDDEPMDDAPQLSDTESSEDEFEEGAVESLVAGRERRKTAGNRYDRGTILEEAADADDADEVTLLFADNEEEEDEEFKSDAEDEDGDMSSSDDEDQGPNAAAGDLEGEQEIQKQAKEERAKKRKADLALTSVAGMRKKLKTDPTRPAAISTLAKTSKKKERVTWVHDQDSGRSSLRKQTIAHRAETIARLKESEAQSKKLKALKEQRDRERARDAPKELTQADRLAEAARVERQNAKSLNRWEAMEKKRQEEQAAKLAALKDRKLEGPVVSWLSQKTKWVHPKLGKIGTKDATELTEPKKRGRKSKAELEQIAAEQVPESTIAISGQTCTEAATLATLSSVDQPKAPARNLTHESETMATPIVEDPQPRIMLSPSEENQDSFLKGIHEYANLQADSSASGSKPVSPAPQDSDVQQDTENKGDPQQDPEKQPEAEQNPGGLSIDSQAPVVRVIPNQNFSDECPESIVFKTEAPAGQTQIAAPLQPGQQIEMPIAAEPLPAPEPAPIEEDSTRNLVMLEKFDELSSEARQDYSIFYNKKTARPAKAVKHIQEVCPITALPIRYRDPSTGIAYANVVAYKKLQELKEHKFAWSTMLRCYIGRGNGTVARGVPEGWG